MKLEMVGIHLNPNLVNVEVLVKVWTFIFKLRWFAIALLFVHWLRKLYE